MEYPRTSLSSAPRFQRFSIGLFTPGCHSHHISDFSTYTRDHYGLHHEEIERLWCWRHDAADAYCADTEEPIHEGQKLAECKLSRFI